MQEIINLHNWIVALPNEIKSEVEKKRSVRQFQKNDVIFNSGDISQCGYQIVTGRVKITNYNKNGREAILTVLHPGDCFGDIGMITNEKRPHFAIACENTELKILTTKDFTNLSMQYPEFGLSMNKFLALRLQFVFNTLDDALLLPLYDRLGNALVRLTFAREFKTHDGMIYLSDISQEMLGQMLGATRQSIGRELKKMEAKELITIKYGKIYIVDKSSFIESFDYNVSHETMIPIYEQT